MIMGAFDNAAWLQHYAEWTPHSIDYGDTTLVDIYTNNLTVNAETLRPTSSARQ